MKITWLVEDERHEWYRLRPAEQWLESQKLWEFYLSSGVSLNPESDSQSPLDPRYAQRQSAADGRSGMRAVRGSGV